MMIRIFEKKWVSGETRFRSRAAVVVNPGDVPKQPPFDNEWAYVETPGDQYGSAVLRVSVDRRSQTNAPKKWGITWNGKLVQWNPELKWFEPFED